MSLTASPTTPFSSELSMPLLEGILALALLTLTGASLYTVRIDLIDPAPVSRDALAAWVILSLLALGTLTLTARTLLDTWATRLRRRPEHDQVRNEMITLLPAHLAAIEWDEPVDFFWLLFTSRGPILRIKSPGHPYPGARIALDDATHQALDDMIHTARRRVFSQIETRILSRGESLFELPAPSNHQVMEALARARRSS